MSYFKAKTFYVEENGRLVYLKGKKVLLYILKNPRKNSCL